ncbi:MAG: DNA-directed RNA polymerase subunit L [Thermoplasmata archaeon]|uniref:DNA-directed RNA polymerase subunit Rpo11 n=1 Tax=Candidatus Sysuiplasma superficiale TaxID=2823368 RepID=A0A8J8CEW5_9ARCH|nr:DNA-directed RNA polymerase subunit L [Candidatus Sysuiplasma superficiale]MBX8644322.1 DNA-directed RNA polymerase subunit L [Candidatus Sysuiplasma superficiale]MCL4347400.1 DNA-directed RNA polymerase subunit L [Candidatus Thermoplasmatota archaeon]
MELKIIREKEKEIEIGAIGADDSLMYPLLTELLQNEKVVEAKYIKGHPDLDVPSLFVRVSSGDPRAALRKAAENLSEDFSSLRKKAEKKLK